MPLAPFPYAGYSEDSGRRVRVLFGDQFIADVENPKLCWEKPYSPRYFFQKSDVKPEFLANPVTNAEGTTTYDLVVGEKTAEGAVTEFGPGPFEGLIKVEPDKTDVWFEEDERMIFPHPRDPYKRITILPSSKHIRVEIDGVEVANSTRSLRLFETRHSVRTYLPMTDVRFDLLSPITYTSVCPYKGEANYFSVNVPSGPKDGYAWWYKSPRRESSDITGLIAFYDEKVDVWVDGVKQDRTKAY